MSLRIFHIVFILSSIILLGGYTYWSAVAYTEVDNVFYLVSAAGSVFGCVLLAFYLKTAIEKAGQEVKKWRQVLAG
ncbi:MAG: hypothetical protein AB8C84_02125 [Oligoflexales bacterium]